LAKIAKIKDNGDPREREAGESSAAQRFSQKS
jgi:hypothetical protein